jgi:hypothetical protein
VKSELLVRKGRRATRVQPALTARTALLEPLVAPEPKATQAQPEPLDRSDLKVKPVLMEPPGPRVPPAPRVTRVTPELLVLPPQSLDRLELLVLLVLLVLRAPLAPRATRVRPVRLEPSQGRR